jgi:hypothetical protein
VSPVKYELGLYIPKDDILHSDLHEDLKSCSDYPPSSCAKVKNDGATPQCALRLHGAVEVQLFLLSIAGAHRHEHVLEWR